MKVNNELKKALWDACSVYVQERIETARQAIASASDAATDDTKSSAGDKFETTREMMQQEISRHHQLLADALQMEQALKGIEPIATGNYARPGSLVFTNHGNFYIAVSAGQLHHGGERYFAVSAASPIGRLFQGKGAGDRFSFNNQQEYQVFSVQ